MFAGRLHKKATSTRRIRQAATVIPIDAISGQPASDRRPAVLKPAIDREASEMTTITGQPSFLATRRGKLTLALLCAVAFLDFVDGSIVNIALPSIRRELHFSVASLVLSLIHI